MLKLHVFIFSQVIEGDLLVARGLSSSQRQKLLSDDFCSVLGASTVGLFHHMINYILKLTLGLYE